MNIASIETITAPAVSEADVSALADRLELTADTGAGDTSLLTSIFAQALDAVERHCSRYFRPRTLALTASADADDVAVLAVNPFRGVTSVTLNGAAVADYTVSPVPGGAEVRFSRPVTGTVVFTVSAGPSTDAAMPPAAMAAVLAVACDLYEHREAQSEVSLTENRTLRFVLAGITDYCCG